MTSFLDTVKDPLTGRTYREVEAREAFVRESAFADVTENLCGFEVRQMALEDFLALHLIKSPFLVGGNPSPEALRQFLWRLSPEYSPRGGISRFLHMRRCLRFLPPQEPLLRTPWAMKRWARRALKALALQGELLIAIKGYMAETMQDWPSGKPDGEGISYYGNGVTMVAMISREYGWGRREILKLQMKEILQYLKEIKYSQPGTKAMFGGTESEAILKRWALDRSKN